MCLGIDNRLHEATRLADFQGTGHGIHGQFRHTDVAPLFSGLVFAHANAAKLGIDEDSIGVKRSRVDDALFALADGLEIDGNGARVDAVLSATPYQIGDACADDHRFGGRTAHVDAGTAYRAALNERHFPACQSFGDGEESAALTGPDHNRIIVCGLWHSNVLLF